MGVKRYVRLQSTGRPMHFRNIAVAAFAAALGLVGFAATARAHAFGERYDLPIPLSYFLVGGAITVALSFVVIGLFVRRGKGERGYPRLNLLAVRGLGAALASPATLFGLRLLSRGRVRPGARHLLLRQRATPGGARAHLRLDSVVGRHGLRVGAVRQPVVLVNPWKTTYEWAERLLGWDGRGLFVYPDRLDVWPAAALLLMFAWLENVYASATLPGSLGQLIIAYSLVTWMGMAAFGKHTWLSRGEVFSVLFGIFARFSPTEMRAADRSACSRCRWACGPDCVDCYECFERADRSRREFNLRPWAVGLANPHRASMGLTAFVLLALAIVSFDGLQETPAWVSVQTAVYDEVSVLGPNVVGTIDTLGLLVVPALFVVVYAAFSLAVARLSGDPEGGRGGGEGVRADAGADRAGLQPGALPVAAADFRPDSNTAAVGPVRPRLGPVGHRRLRGEHSHNQRAGGVVRVRGGDSGGARGVGVPGAPDVSAQGGAPGTRAARAASHAAADGAVHGHQPVDNRAAHRGGVEFP